MNKVGDNFTLLTEDCPKMRTRFGKIYRPSVKAWLLMIGYRAGKTLKHLQQLHADDRTRPYDAAVRDQQLRLEIISDLIAQTDQPWNRLEWLDACQDVERLQLGGPTDDPPVPPAGGPKPPGRAA